MIPQNIMLGAGTMYINGQPFEGIQKITFEEESELDILGKTERPLIVNPQSEITFTATIPGEMAALLMNNVQKAVVWERWKAMCKYYPNQRIVHLANRHHDPLVRKKNAKRIMRHYKIKI